MDGRQWGKGILPVCRGNATPVTIVRVPRLSITIEKGYKAQRQLQLNLGSIVTGLEPVIRAGLGEPDDVLMLVDCSSHECLPAW